MGQGDVLETELLCDPSDAQLMLRTSVAMSENDCERVNAGSTYTFQLGPEVFLVKWNHFEIHRIGSAALVHNQRHWIASPLKQCVCGHGCTHPHPTDQPGIDQSIRRQSTARFLLQNTPDAFGRCIRIVGRIDGKQLQRTHRTVGCNAQHIRKGTATINRKVLHYIT
uniref:Uncharacterized protein n=1 Tax=Anopheles culicifacies TaxID=139723 RepID=A0A182MR33_9DIPT